MKCIRIGNVLFLRMSLLRYVIVNFLIRFCKVFVLVELGFLFFCLVDFFGCIFLVEFFLLLEVLLLLVLLRLFFFRLVLLLVFKIFFRFFRERLKRLFIEFERR